MDQIHNKLMQSSKAYSDWHEHPHHKKFHWGIAIIVALILCVMLLKGIAYWKYTLYSTETIKFAPRTAVLTLEPQTKSVKVGDIFPVNIVLDAADGPADGVDIYELHYDPTILSVVDDLASQDGVQITPGSLMEVTILNKVDSKTGSIVFSQATQGGSSYTGKGTLATVNFKAIKKGSAYLKFDFSLRTRDTNVAHGGRDRLLDVVDGAYIVE